MQSVQWIGLLLYVLLAGGGAAMRGLIGWWFHARPKDEPFAWRKFATTLVNGFAAGAGIAAGAYFFPEVPGQPTLLSGFAAVTFGYTLDSVNKDAVRTWLFKRLDVETWEQFIEVVLAKLSKRGDQ